MMSPCTRRRCSPSVSVRTVLHRALTLLRPFKDAADAALLLPHIDPDANHIDRHIPVPLFSYQHLAGHGRGVLLSDGVGVATCT